ncbi:Plasmid stabilization system protein [Aquisphaera giovannonii]|uniref:Plasmid stabilization system protein n=1 Tax=Aquisphaera giovannonii TaxID=406548 RepID=A0A5B9W9G0_9BACT|nr:type II toxin-antitoxin system RelE/ParE family toxin [Aquisphaera giovannonii]QEH36711.1 Plasmid stabilization system protein [Aquisphaera giovannonii]
MNYQVRVLAKARRDLESILRYIALKSPAGAARLLGRFQAEMKRLEREPYASAVAPEADEVGEEVRHALFRTRAGRTYRAIFVIVGEEVRILRVRGSGQPPVRDWELKE